jgi:2-keto-4-pentenoate hydratase/2-oxohepta-3-ene-1,7-dioic acid hydratase in catechol pathway
MSYKLLTYDGGRGPRAGLYIGDKVVDLAEAIEAHGKRISMPGATTLEVLSVWDEARPVLREIAADGAAKLPGKKLEEVKLKAPILYPGGYFGATANYSDHIVEMRNEAPPDKSKDRPCFLQKTTVHSIIGHNEPAHLRPMQTQIFWEGELGVVIGRKARAVKAASALDYVAGYTICNDLSDATHFYQRMKDFYGRWFGVDWFRGKCWDTSGPMGPWITPAEDVPDPQNLTIKTETKGEVMQNGTTANMVFTVAEQIEYITETLTLRPGDVISTGTCKGVGRPRGLFLQHGDVVNVTIGNLGTLTTPIVRDNEP